MNKADILRGKCEAILEAMNNVNNEQHELFKKYLENKIDILLDKYIILGEIWQMLMKQYKKYIDELVTLSKGGE